ncbi:MAG: SH3 domain-containing protein [Candidatus Woesebacteria bacterium]|nr:MAG: SH3 domain-containing protein [Candidatus Woesebacteria bacterium]
MSTKFASALALTLLMTAAVFSPSEVTAAAGGIQNCIVGSTCTVGEFLYDDNSAPIAGATCSVTSEYPNLSSFLAAQPLSGGGVDGWYYYSFTAPSTTGMYPTTIACVVSGDTLKIDKSFQIDPVPASVPDTNSIATAVWGFSGKTLDSFGTLPADIWSYSTRTVSSIGSFGTLIADIWANATRTLTGAGLTSGDLATKSDLDNVNSNVDSVKSKVGDISTTTAVTNVTNVTNSITDIKNVTTETRLLLEKVVNKPVIQNVLENTTVPLSDKLSGTRSMANQLYVNNQFLTAQSATLTSNWNKTNGKDLLDGVIALSNILGSSADSSDANTMFGSVNWIRDSWNWDESSKVYDQLVTTDKIISDLKEGLADYQKSPALYAQAKLLVKSSLALEKSIGTVSDSSPAKTLFVRIKTTQDLATKLDEKGNQVDKILGAFTKSKDVEGTVSQIGIIQNQIIALNKVSGASGALVKVNPTDTNSVKNALLGLRGIINSNKMLLSLGSGKTLVSTWLEIGSIVFKTLATNPSTLISQTVDVKYYLPQEIKKDDIIKSDPGLTVNYDSEKDQLYVSGTFNLAAGQTRTFSVETKDIWEITPTEIQSMRDQAAALYKPLEKTAFFAQGVTLKSDIDASMSQISILIDGATTPEDKIKAYRQAEVLKASAETKLTAMKELVAQASAAGSLFGFVGGSQAIAVWGIIIVIASGFVFMAMYMNTITSRAKAQLTAGESQISNTDVKKPSSKGSKVHPASFIAVMLFSSVVSAAATGYVVSRVVANSYEQKMAVLGVQSSEPVSTPVPMVESKSEPESYLEQENLGVGGQYLVVVSDTPTGFLRVRKTPGGQEIAKVSVGDRLPFLEDAGSWYKVQLEDGTEGFVSKEYSSKE